MSTVLPRGYTWLGQFAGADLKAVARARSVPRWTIRPRMTSLTRVTRTQDRFYASCVVPSAARET